MGRKSKNSIILNNLEVIKQLKSNGATDVQIAKHLGVCPATWYKVLKESPELQEVMEDAKVELVDGLVGELYKKARVHSLVTTKTIERGDEVIIETTTKEVDSDTAAITFLLKNVDRGRWSNEPDALELKKKELELKEKALEKDLW